MQVASGNQGDDTEELAVEIMSIDIFLTAIRHHNIALLATVSVIALAIIMGNIGKLEP